MFFQQNLTASPHIMSTNTWAIPVKKGEKFFCVKQLLEGSSQSVYPVVYFIFFVVHGYSTMF